MASLSTTTPATQDGGPPSQLYFDNTLGAAFIGLIFAAILYGVTNIQTFIYYQNAAKDRIYMKWTHLALISHYLYDDLVTNFANPAYLEKPTWSLCLHFLVTTVSDLVVRLFYVRRVWIMSDRNRFLLVGMLALTFMCFSFGLGFSIKILFYTSTSQFSQIIWLFDTSVCSGISAEAWIAVTLCYYLGRKKTGFRSTEKLINTLMLYVIGTGLFTSFCSISTIITATIMPYNHVCMIPYFSSSKLYFNALLVSLNARGSLREVTTDSGDDAGTFQMRGRSPSNSKGATLFGTENATSESLGRFGLDSECKGRHEVEIIVRTETEYHTDKEGVLPNHYTSTLSC